MQQDELETLIGVLLDYIERYGLTDKARAMFEFEPHRSVEPGLQLGGVYNSAAFPVDPPATE